MYKQFSCGKIILILIAHYTEGKRLAISYNGLWKQLIDHRMKKGDLCEKTGLSSSTIAKMTNCESVKLSVLEKICKELDCNFGDLIDYVPDEKEKYAE